MSTAAVQKPVAVPDVVASTVRSCDVGSAGMGEGVEGGVGEGVGADEGVDGGVGGWELFATFFLILVVFFFL